MDTPKYESAKLILELYDLRRETKMREARDWWFTFKPKSAEDIKNAMYSADSAKCRMVIGYWDMAAALVNHKAIDESMFNDTNGEHIVIFTKIQPFLEELREKMGDDWVLQLERLIMRMPDAHKVIEETREWLSKM